MARFLNNFVLIIEDTKLQVSQQWYRSVTSPLNGDTIGMDKLSFDRDFIENCLQSAVDNGVLRSDTPVPRSHYRSFRRHITEPLRCGICVGQGMVTY